MVSLLVLAALFVVGALLWLRLRSDHRITTARALIQRRDFDAASDQLEQALAGGADAGEVSFWKARVARLTGDMEAMSRYLLEALDGGVSPDRLTREKWLVLAQSGAMVEAETHMSELLTNPQGDGAAICEAFVNGYFGIQQFEAAFPLLKGWEADFPDDPQPHLYWATYYQHLSDWHRAEQALREGIRLGPERLEFRTRLVDVLFEQQQYDHCLTEASAALQLAPGDVDLAVVQAKCKFRLGDVDAARGMLEELHETHPQHVDCQLTLAQLESEAGSAERVLELLEPIMETRPWDYVSRKMLASAYRRLGDDEKALEQFEKIAVVNESKRRVEALIAQLPQAPQDAELRYQIGAEILAHGNPVEGRRVAASRAQSRAQPRAGPRGPRQLPRIPRRIPRRR